MFSVFHHESNGSVEELHNGWLVVILLVVFERRKVQSFQKVGESVTSNDDLFLGDCLAFGDVLLWESLVFFDSLVDEILRNFK